MKYDSKNDEEMFKHMKDGMRVLRIKHQKCDY